MISILLINHREKQCGVQAYGKRLFEPALSSARYDCNYIDIDNEVECQYWINQIQPRIIVYNYYNGTTMPWLSQGFLDAQSVKQLCIFHEVPIDLRFDGIVCQDPTDINPSWHKIARPIPLYTNTEPFPDVPTFGSFGFGLGGKGFGSIIDRVQEEYDRAIIKINIPFAAFGDANGRGAGDWARYCHTRIQKPGLELRITHDFFEEKDLLDFLAGNTCNCFFYEQNYGRGISGTLDYCLAVDRPIAITKSHQFKHFWQNSKACLIEGQSLQQIISAGTEPLALYHSMWGFTNVLQDWESIFRAYE